MVSASFQDQHIESLWSIAQIIVGFGTVACMCCALFLGLKLKWFRAQFKVQDMPKNKKSSNSVQGIGFKIKTNSEDFQHYKSISEFATPEVNLSNGPNNKNHSNNGNHSSIPKKVSKTNEEKSDASAKVENRNNKLRAENLNMNTESTSISIKTNEVLTETNTSEIRSSHITTEESKETLVDEYQNKTEIKKSKVSFAKNTAVQQTNTERVETVKVSSEERNSLSAQNIVMPQEDEDNWNIRIVAEKPKVQIDNRNDDIYYEEIHLTNNRSNQAVSNSMYSSQAASIFFGSYDEKQPPDSPPPPIPRKFLEDQDTISMGSQTSA